MRGVFLFLAWYFLLFNSTDYFCQLLVPIAWTFPSILARCSMIAISVLLQRSRLKLLPISLWVIIWPLKRMISSIYFLFQGNLRAFAVFVSKSPLVNYWPQTNFFTVTTLCFFRCSLPLLLKFELTVVHNFCNRRLAWRSNENQVNISVVRRVARFDT